MKRLLYFIVQKPHLSNYDKSNKPLKSRYRQPTKQKPILQPQSFSLSIHNIPSISLSLSFSLFLSRSLVSLWFTNPARCSTRQNSSKVD
mmetsp:Transcript_28873/g.60793  ORF Transcript_28873/g.60793 Transcript_28873/m.60793 type:complete len:89 (+) Transcript_28873:21-287(+)